VTSNQPSRVTQIPQLCCFRLSVERLFQMTFETDPARSRTESSGRRGSSTGIVGSDVECQSLRWGSSEDNEEKLLQLAPRLESQWKSITSLFSSESALDKATTLWICQSAVLLSPRNFWHGYCWQLSSGVKYQSGLASPNEWHKLIHGSANAHKAAHGIHGGTHTVLILIVPRFLLEERDPWMCFDGTNGDIHAKTVLVSSSVVQIAPLAGVGSCRQGWYWCSKTRSVSVIP
jgi:hypothetical protein